MRRRLAAGWIVAGLREKREVKMLETIAVILIILWLLGFVSSYTMGGFIHILLVVAIVVILIRVIQGRRPL
jgi:hypothetical protein